MEYLKVTPALLLALGFVQQECVCGKARIVKTGSKGSVISLDGTIASICARNIPLPLFITTLMELSADIATKRALDLVHSVVDVEVEIIETLTVSVSRA